MFTVSIETLPFDVTATDHNQNKRKILEAIHKPSAIHLCKLICFKDIELTTTKSPILPERLVQQMQQTPINFELHLTPTITE